VGVIGVGFLRDRVLGARRPTGLHEVSACVEALTPEWMTAALCGNVPGAVVTGIDIRDGSDGTSCRRALTVDYDAAGCEAGLPTALFAKTSASFTSRLTLGASGVVEGEVLFYNKIRPTLKLNSPHGYYSACDTRWWRSMILIEDVARTRGCSFGSPLRPVTRDEAESMVAQMAAYHGAYWNSPALTSELRRLKDAHRFQSELNVIGFAKRTPIGMERSADVIPPEIMARKDEIFGALMDSLTLHAAHSRTLLHQTPIPETGSATATDRWACTTGPVWHTAIGPLDFSYALTTCLETEDRRNWERDLLELYLHHLAESGAGVDVPPYDDAWLSYRQHPLHGLVWWLFTIGSGRLQPDMQPAEHSLVNIRRATQAIADLGTLDALEIA
jgi:hypothetical protein